MVILSQNLISGLFMKFVKTKWRENFPVYNITHYTKIHRSILIYNVKITYISKDSCIASDIKWSVESTTDITQATSSSDKSKEQPYSVDTSW